MTAPWVAEILSRPPAITVADRLGRAGEHAADRLPYGCAHPVADVLADAARVAASDPSLDADAALDRAAGSPRNGTLARWWWRVGDQSHEGRWRW